MHTPQTSPSPLTAVMPQQKKLRTLIVEDDYTSRALIQRFLRDVADCEVVTNGFDAVESFNAAMQNGTPYDLICMDIMMPGMNGQEALRRIRSIEEDLNVLPHQGVKIVMTTAIDSLSTVRDSFFQMCDGYIVKPIRKNDFLDELRSIRLIN